MSISASLQGKIAITDNITGSVSLSKNVSQFYTGTIESYGQSIIIGTSPVSVTLPISPVQFVYVKNLSSVLANTVTVTWTPASGTSAVVITLDPGALIIFSEVVTTNGITALSLTASAAGTPVEFVVCG